MSYTKDPWKLAADNSPFIYALNKRGSNSFWVYVTPGSDDNKKRTSDSEVLANAKLISAAPELLEALELIIKYPDIDKYVGSVIFNKCFEVIKKTTA